MTTKDVEYHLRQIQAWCTEAQLDYPDTPEGDIWHEITDSYIGIEFPSSQHPMAQAILKRMGRIPYE